mmetsp:Transcript_39515/g.58147  ORF Transcript_39515/g.58147 Transcript_39515/m.58147 type:complete len:211 (+) Transcript_39515:78-710(+)
MRGCLPKKRCWASASINLKTHNNSTLCSRTARLRCNKRCNKEKVKRCAFRDSFPRRRQNWSEYKQTFPAQIQRGTRCAVRWTLRRHKLPRRERKLRSWGGDCRKCRRNANGKLPITSGYAPTTFVKLNRLLRRVTWWRRWRHCDNMRSELISPRKASRPKKTQANLPRKLMFFALRVLTLGRADQGCSGRRRRATSRRNASTCATGHCPN